MPKLPDISVDFTANTAGFTAATQRMAREVEQMRRSVESHLTGMRTAATSFAGNFARGMAAAFTVDRIIAFGRATVDMAAGLGDAAAQAGLTTDQLQEYRFMASAGGATNEQVSSSFAKLTQNIGDAASGQDSAVAAFARAGVAFRDTAGHVRTTDAVFIDLVARLNRIPDLATRVALGTLLMGENYRRIAGMVNQGTAAMEAQRQEAHASGAILSGEWAQRANDFSLAMTRVSHQIMVALGPAMIRIAEAIGVAAVAASGFIDTLSRIPAILGMMGPQARLVELDRQINAMADAGVVLADELQRARDAGQPETVIGSIRSRAEQHLRLAETIQRERDALAGTLPPPVRLPTLHPGAPGAGAVPVDPAAARQAAQQAKTRAQEAERETEKRIKQYDTLVGSLDKVGAAQIAYREQLVQIGLAEKFNLGTTQERALLTARAGEQYRDATLAAVGLTDAFKNQAAGAEQLRDRIAALNNLLAAGSITTEQYANLMRRATAEASLGAAGWQNFVKATEGVADAITSGLETALLRAKSVREALADIVTEIQKVLLHELLIAPIRAAISSGLQSLGSMAFGSSTAPVGGGIAHAAAGGVVSAPTLAVVGEGADPEAIIPMPGGRGVPVVMKGGGNVAAPNVAFHIDARNAEVGVERRIMDALRSYEPGLIGRLMDAAKRGGAFAKAFGRA